MRARSLACTALVAAAACGRAPSGGAGCPPDPSKARAPVFEVVVSSKPTQVRRDLDMAALARLPHSENLDGKLQGLTVFQHRLAVRTEIAVTRPFFGGQACAWLERVTVDLTPVQAVIYTPSDYAEDSCQTEQILAHERQHEETHREVLAEEAESMRRALAAAADLPGPGAPLPAADRPDAERLLGQRVDEAASPVYAGFLEELGRRQAVIDLPENYRWVARRCPSWK